MKKIITKGLASVSLMLFMAGCGQTVPGINTGTDVSECANINKKLLKIDEYIVRVNSISAFHMEEAALALNNPQISTSNNKKDMLKDAGRKRTKLLSDSQKYGCQPYK